MPAAPKPIKFFRKRRDRQKKSWGSGLQFYHIRRSFYRKLRGHLLQRRFLSLLLLGFPLFLLCSGANSRPFLAGYYDRQEPRGGKLIPSLLPLRRGSSHSNFFFFFPHSNNITFVICLGQNCGNKRHISPLSQPTGERTLFFLAPVFRRWLFPLFHLIRTRSHVCMRVTHTHTRAQRIPASCGRMHTRLHLRNSALTGRIMCLVLSVVMCSKVVLAKLQRSCVYIRHNKRDASTSILSALKHLRGVQFFSGHQVFFFFSQPVQTPRTFEDS